MPDKLTDAEIVKAFELCFAEIGTAYTCTLCPYHKFGELCKVKRNRDTFDLINRLKEENDRFKNSWKAGVILAIRTEAYKEFAERFNKEAEKVEIDREGDFVETNDKIYDTVANW